MTSPQFLREFKKFDEDVQNASRDCVSDLMTEEIIESYRFIQYRGKHLRVSIRVLQETDDDLMLARMGAESGTTTLDHPKASQNCLPQITPPQQEAGSGK